MQFNETEFAALDAGASKVGIFFRLDTTTRVCLWSGVGDIEPGIDTVDTETGMRYRGIGALESVPELGLLLNGAAERADFALSGIDADVIALATAEDAPAIVGKDVDIGICLMGASWNQLGPIRWIRRYIADLLSAKQSLAESADGAVVRSITLSAVSHMSRRRRPQYAYLSDADQQRRSPGDKACERIAIYEQQVEKTWPNWQY